MIESGKLCFDRSGKPLSEKESKVQFKKQMYVISETILERIETFVWTINRDGRDYRPGNLCGCSGVNTMGEKEKVRGKHCDLKHGRDSLKKIKSLTMGK
ncbi:hypothetical protein [Bacterioplanoides sp.]|uniref:hypothetical protein n=1 Tax=Bacterioplanoides sp. TaxID=2066072 RepID=UPI003B004849